METKMIKIERNEKMEAAAARCRNVHPKVRRVDAQTVTVYGSKGAAYTVKFAEPREGLKLAACDCPAGQASQLCYHIPAALVAPVVKTGVAAQPVADERATLIETVKAAWHRARPFAAIEDAVRRTFGVSKLDALTDDDLMQIAAVLG